MPRFLIIWLDSIIRSVKNTYKTFRDTYTGVGEPDRARRARRVGNRGYWLGCLALIVRVVLILTGTIRPDGFTANMLTTAMLVCWASALQMHSFATGYAIRYREEPMDLDTLDRRPDQAQQMVDKHDRGEPQ